MKDLYFGLFKTEVMRDRYMFFNAIRVMVMDLLHLPRNNFENTDLLFLSEKKWQIILNKLLGYEISEIKDFQRSLLRKVRVVKHEKQENLLRYMKGNHFNVTFFLREAIGAYILKAEEREKKANFEAEKLVGETSKAAAQSGRGRARSLYDYLKIDELQADEELEEIREKKRRQKEVLKKEIKTQIKLINK